MDDYDAPTQASAAAAFLSATAYVDVLTPTPPAARQQQQPPASSSPSVASSAPPTPRQRSEDALLPPDHGGLRSGSGSGSGAHTEDWTLRAQHQLEAGRLGRVPDWKDKLRRYVGEPSSASASRSRSRSPSPHATTSSFPAAAAAAAHQLQQRHQQHRHHTSPQASAALPPPSLPQRGSTLLEHQHHHHHRAQSPAASSSGAPPPPGTSAAALHYELEALRAELAEEKAAREKAESSLTYVSKADAFDPEEDSLDRLFGTPPSAPFGLPQPGPSPLSLPQKAPSFAVSALTPASAMAKGDHVRVHSLPAHQTHLNGRYGVVSDTLVVNGAIIVVTARVGDSDVQLKPENCQVCAPPPPPEPTPAPPPPPPQPTPAVPAPTPPAVAPPAAEVEFTVGASVRIVGMRTNQEMNGQSAVVTGRHETPEHGTLYQVAIAGDPRNVRVRAKNLELAPSSSPPPQPQPQPPAAAPAAQQPPPPPQASPASNAGGRLKAGARVELVGLSNQKHLNGRVGVVERVVDHNDFGLMYCVNLDGDAPPGGSTRMQLRPKNLKELAAPAPAPTPPPQAAPAPAAAQQQASSQSPPMSPAALPGQPPLSPASARREASAGAAAGGGGGGASGGIDTGDTIVIHSLSKRHDLNGKNAVVKKVVDHPTHGRFAIVEVAQTGESVQLHTKNTRQPSSAAATAAAAAAAPAFTASASAGSDAFELLSPRSGPAAPAAAAAAAAGSSGSIDVGSRVVVTHVSKEPTLAGTLGVVTSTVAHPMHGRVFQVEVVGGATAGRQLVLKASNLAPAPDSATPPPVPPPPPAPKPKPKRIFLEAVGEVHGLAKMAEMNGQRCVVSKVATHERHGEVATVVLAGGRAVPVSVANLRVGPSAEQDGSALCPGWRRRAMEADQYCVGDAVRLHSLAKMPELNGQEAVVLSGSVTADQGLVLQVDVRSPSGAATVAAGRLSVREANVARVLPPLDVGACVSLGGLAEKAELNGKEAVVKEMLSDGLYSVKLADGGYLRARRANLNEQLVGGGSGGGGSAAAAGAAGAAASSSSSSFGAAGGRGEEEGGKREEAREVQLNDAVEIKGLANKKFVHLNGRVGVVKQVMHHPSQGCVLSVEVPDEEELVTLLQRNVSVVDDAARALRPGCAAPPPSHPPPEWLSEYPAGCKVSVVVAAEAAAASAAALAALNDADERAMRALEGRVGVVKDHLIDPAHPHGALVVVEAEKKDKMGAGGFSIKAARENLTRTVVLMQPEDADGADVARLHDRFPEGSRVLAVGLATGINGLRGTLKKKAGKIGWVDFGPPHDMTPILLGNLRHEGSVEVEDVRTGTVFLFTLNNSKDNKVIVEVDETGVFYEVKTARVNKEGVLVWNEALPSENRLTLPPGVSRYLVPQLGRLFFLHQVPCNIPPPNPLAYVQDASVQVVGLSSCPTLNGLQGKIEGLDTAPNGYIFAVKVQLPRSHGVMKLRPENLKIV